MASILVLNGPNLDRLGSREPEVYGSVTLAEIDAGLAAQAQSTGHTLECFQSNAEHELVERLHAAADAGVDYVLLNPAAFTHTSVALRDALLAAAIPFVELHLTNVGAREAFRQQNYFSDIAIGTVSGFGADSYTLALDAVLRR